MRTIILPVILVALVAVFRNGSSSALAAAYGDVIVGEISTTIEVDTIAFFGTSGDIIIVRTNRLSGDINPYVRCFDANNGLVFSISPSGGYGEVATAYDLHISGQPPFRLLVSDDDASNAGGYSLAFECVNEPGAAEALSYGDLVNDSTIAHSEIQSYQFGGSINDKIFLRMNRVGGNIRPYVRLYGPNSVLLYEAGPQGGYSEVASIVDLLLPQSGLYTMLVMDGDGHEPGNYNLKLECINAPGRADTVAYGALIRDSIETKVEDDVYRFMGTASDLLFLRMNRVGGLIRPYIRLYGPNDSLVYDAVTQGGYSEISWITDYSLPQSGWYTMLVLDSDGHEFGNYHLKLECINAPGRADTVAYGALIRDSIETKVEDDVYRFMGTASDLLFLRMNRVGGLIRPYIRLYGPNDSLVYVAVTQGGYSEISWIIDYSLPQSGWYTMLVLDSDGHESGDYFLTFDCVSSPSFANSLTCGDSLSESINPIGDLDIYEFSGSSGDTVSLLMLRTGGDVRPYMRLYAPSGCNIFTAGPEGWSGELGQIDKLALPMDGIYRLLAADSDSHQGGDYSLRFQCIDGDYFRCGDVDQSGRTNIGDAVVLVNYIFAGGPLPKAHYAADCNCSCKVSIGYAVCLINYIFASGPPPCSSCYRW